MAELPSGTVTFLFTDIEGSTRRWERDAAAHGGAVFRTVGDAVQAAFPTAPAALVEEGVTRQAIGHGCGGVGVTVHGDPSSGGDVSHAGAAKPAEGGVGRLTRETEPTGR